jgi:hypothetical protein
MNPPMFSKQYPVGRFICQEAKHVVAWVDGTRHDLFQAHTRRCIYGACRRALTKERERSPNRRPTETRTIQHQAFTFVASIGRDSDGRLAEVFISSRKSGSDMAAAARDANIVVSIALQRGVSPEVIRRALGRNSDGSAASPLGVVLDQLAAEGAL